MKLKVLFFVFLVASLFLTHSEAFISVNIDPDDLDSVSEFFQIIINNRQPQMIIRSPVHRAFKSLAKKAIFGCIQLFGVVVALVGSNIISSKMIPDVPVSLQQHQQTEMKLMVEQILLQNSTNGACMKDFGCHKNVCWRACFATPSETHVTWCFTSPTTQVRKYQPCASSSDCSPFWECLEDCHL